MRVGKARLSEAGVGGQLPGSSALVCKDGQPPLPVPALRLRDVAQLVQRRRMQRLFLWQHKMVTLQSSARLRNSKLESC